MVDKKSYYDSQADNDEQKLSFDHVTRTYGGPAFLDPSKVSSLQRDQYLVCGYGIPVFVLKTRLWGKKLSVL